MTAATIHQASSQLLFLPHVPLATTEALVRAGLRMQFTTAKLTADAHADVGGCATSHSVWLATHSSAGVSRQQWGSRLLKPVEDACLRCPLAPQVGTPSP
jgi:hypothetical protein